MLAEVNTTKIIPSVFFYLGLVELVQILNFCLKFHYLGFILFLQIHLKDSLYIYLVNILRSVIILDIQNIQWHIISIITSKANCLQNTWDCFWYLHFYCFSVLDIFGKTDIWLFYTYLFLNVYTKSFLGRSWRRHFR